MASTGCEGDSLSDSSPPAAPGARGEDAGILCISRLCPAQRPPGHQEDKNLQFQPAQHPLAWRGLVRKPCSPNVRTNAPPTPQVPGGSSSADTGRGADTGDPTRGSTVPSRPNRHSGYR